MLFSRLLSYRVTDYLAIVVVKQASRPRNREIVIADVSNAFV